MYELKNNINNYLHLDIRDGQANELGDYYIRGCIYDNKINDIIENTPFISDVRKNFYKKMISYRKELIFDKAYGLLIRQNS